MEGEGPAPKKSKEKTVFISYASKDSEQADRLYKDLKNAGLNPWLDEHNLLPGHKRKIEIRKAINSADYFIPLLSSNSVDERGCTG